MKFSPRNAQLGRLVGYSLFSVTPNEETPDSDAYFDGTPIGNKPVALHWIEEHDVHQAPALSHSVDSNRVLLGPQMLAVRDELRNLTHVACPDASGVSLVTLSNGRVVSRTILFRGLTRRAHVSLRKHDGQAFILHCSGSDKQSKVYLNDQHLESLCGSPDFPFMDFAQPPIGHPALTPPAFALLSYKSRESGELYIRSMSDETVGPERVISAPKTVGGVDFAIGSSQIIFRINAIRNGRVVPMMATSDDNGESISAFEDLDLSKTPFEEFLPANTPIQLDHLGNPHIPVSAVNESSFNLLDYIPGQVVTEALVVDKQSRNYELLMPFPKRPGVVRNNIGVGNGLTDGVGMIATAISDGKIFSANSQSGGIHYPEPAFLNYDMPRVFALKASPCYTRSIRSNTVSMDYLFIESDDQGTAISQNLWLETWDMPLPAPSVKASESRGTITVELLGDGFFYPGGTTFVISDPAIQISKVVLESDRRASIKCDSDDLSGLIIRFESRNRFYYHAGSGQIE